MSYNEDEEELENGMTKSEYEANQGPLDADWSEYSRNVEASGSWDDEDCPPENVPDCDR